MMRAMPRRANLPIVISGGAAFSIVHCDQCDVLFHTCADITRDVHDMRAHSPLGTLPTTMTPSGGPLAPGPSTQMGVPAQRTSDSNSGSSRSAAPSLESAVVASNCAQEMVSDQGCAMRQGSDAGEVRRHIARRKRQCTLPGATGALQ
jgi:hypothetical protein